MDAQLTATAAADGLTIRLRPRPLGGSTFDGHRLVHLAAAHGQQDAMKERLLRAYFSEGALISDHATLQALGVDVGLPADDVRELLLDRALRRGGSRRRAHRPQRRHQRGPVLRHRPQVRRVRARSRPRRCSSSCATAGRSARLRPPRR